MANLRDFTEDIGVQKATDARLGLVKGGGDTHINDDGQIEILNNYGGPFKVSLSGTTIYIDSGRIHDGNNPAHTVILVQPYDSLTVTEGTTNAIWMVISVVDDSINVGYMKTTSTTQAPVITTEGTFFCILLASIAYTESGVPLIQQSHYGDIIINGVSY